MLRSANRDEDVFDQPFRFDIGREPNPHVTFGGGGPHHCLGAMLARAEIRAVFDELLPRIQRIELGEPSVANPSLISNMFIFDKWPVTVVPR
jgi:cytochrome P450